MKVELDKAFKIAAPASAAWQFLQQIEAVAACMPGAEITERIDEHNYKGKVKSKIGPATMAFDGAIEIKGIDPEKRELRLRGSGQDTKGTSSASMDLTAWVVDGAEAGCELKGQAEVSVNGKVASLGGRMMNQVADQILNQFGKNFTDNVLAAGSDEQAEEARAQLAAKPRELNALALAWSVLLSLLKRLFKKGD